MEIKFGIVAVLEALSPGEYSQGVIRELVHSWKTLVDEPVRLGKMPGWQFEPEKLEVYIFRDNLAFLLETGHGQVSRGEITYLSLIIRKLLVDAMRRGVFMRGAIAIGEYDEDREAKVVTGDAYNDALQWYSKPAWSGIVTTPFTTIFLEDVIPASKLIVAFEVPLEAGRRQRMKALNWPEVLYVPELTPCKPGDDPRERLEEALQRYKEAVGSDERVSNTIEFFAHVVNEQGLGR